MKISKLLKNKTTFSFEVFPPKQEQSLDPLKKTLEKLYTHSPDFISVTYGAGGTNAGRSLEVCRLIMEANQTILPHFTCIGNTYEKVDKHTLEYLDMGVENILLLRGDLPKGWSHTQGDFSYATDLIDYFTTKNKNAVDIAVAAYPEMHLESMDINSDLRILKTKAEKGGSFFITQLCHNLENYKIFLENVRKADIDKPIIAGIMPILSRPGVINMSLNNGCSIPRDLARIIGKYEDDPIGFKEAGKEWTAKLIQKYIALGVEGIHLYTLNKYEDIQDILEAINR
jgi:methylenetetrahydrofolate reductase (NADPH)